MIFVSFLLAQKEIFVLFVFQATVTLECDDTILGERSQKREMEVGSVMSRSTERHFILQSYEVLLAVAHQTV